MTTCEITNLEIEKKFVFSPDVILCGWLGSKHQLTNKYCIPPSFLLPRSRELRTQKLKSHLMRAQSLKVLLLKPAVGHYIAMYATLTARDFFLPNFYPSGPFTCIFSQKLSRDSPVLAVANTGSCVGPKNKISHPVGCRFPCWALTEYR